MGYTLTVADPAIDESGKVYSFTLKNSILTSVPVKKVWRDSATASRATDWDRWPCRLVGYSSRLRCRGSADLSSQDLRGVRSKAGNLACRIKKL